MGGLNGRLSRLEGRIQPHEDEDAALRRTIIRMILNEFAHLKASRAGGHRGGKPIVPDDIPFRELGPGYTTGEMIALAIRRVVERQYDDLGDEAREAIIEGWTQSIKEWSRLDWAVAGRSGFDWNKVEDEP